MPNNVLSASFSSWLIVVLLALQAGCTSAWSKDRQALPMVDQSGEPAGHMPSLGSCMSTTVAQVTTRLEGVRDSGTAVIYADGHAQVSYDRVPNATHARRGDPVRLCAIEVPADCPPKDFRGVVYQATDLRRHLTWTMRNAEHGCWGA